MSNDLVSDMLTRIRNATLVRQNYTLIQYSKLNVAILNVLVKEGYLENFSFQEISSEKKLIKAFLKYKGWWIKKPFFSILKRISKPGQRIFLGYQEFQKKFPNLQYGQGLAIISTSSGVMSHKKALKLKKGGEILCYIE